jgi:hypothetical protein
MVAGIMVAGTMVAGTTVAGTRIAKIMLAEITVAETKVLASNLYMWPHIYYIFTVCTTTNCTVYYIICDREEQTQTFYTGVHTLATLDTLTIQKNTPSNIFPVCTCNTTVHIL